MDFKNATSLSPIDEDQALATLLQQDDPLAGYIVPRTPEEEREYAESCELLYVPNQSFFGAVSKEVAKLGWSIFPQERDGKRTPGKIYGEMIKWGGLKDRAPSSDTIHRWASFCATLNIAVVFGPASGDTFALDIDVTDAAMSREIVGIADEILGYTPFRREGREPKLALIYRQPPGEGNRVASVSRRIQALDDAGQPYAGEHMVEVLADGKPLTIDGIHHGTGRYFSWLGRIEDQPSIKGPEHATLVSVEQVEEFMAAVDARFPFWTRPRSAGEPIEYGDYSGLRVPKLRIDYKRNAAGRMVDGRYEYMKEFTFRFALANGEAVLDAAQAGEDALRAIKGNLVGASIAHFCEVAECNGRWAEAKLEGEITGMLTGVVDRIRSGKLTPSRASSFEAEPVVEEAAEPVTDPAQIARNEIVAQIRADAEREATERHARYQEEIKAKAAETRAANKAKADGLVVDGEADDRSNEICVPYIPLGFGKGFHYYITKSGELRKLTDTELTSVIKLTLLDDQAEWSDRFPSKRGIDTNRAAEFLMRESERAGLFSPSRVRGRGLSYDEGRTVLHLGDRLLVDGEDVHPREMKSKFVYSLLETTDMDVGEPLSDEQGELFIRMVQEISWSGDKKGQGALFAGWLVSAVLCGGLDWRPHAYVAGEKGQGKGWVLNNLVKPVLGKQAFSVKGKTTEAAIRRKLGCDARPVTFDEFETQNAKDRADKQQVLDLARAASEEDDTSIIKASSEGDGVNEFRIRSSFAFFSINLNLSQAADESRTLVFELRQPANSKLRQQGFERCAELHRELFDEEFSARFLGRALLMLPVLRTAAKVFKRILVRQGREDRTGDTWGTAIAGAWCLTHGAEPTVTEAEAFLKDHGWDAATEESEALPEWRRALDHLIQQRVFVRTGNGGEDFQLGEIVNQLAGYGDHSCIKPEADLRRALGEFGLRVEGYQMHAVVLVANTSAAIKEVFERTDWGGTAWKATVGRADGATKRDTEKFGSLTSRSTAIPYVAFMGH